MDQSLDSILIFSLLYLQNTLMVINFKILKYIKTRFKILK